MGFGLNISDNTLKNPEENDWINYNGIMMSKMRAAGLKAAKKRKENAEKKLYGNREEKKQILNKIVKTIIDNTGETSEGFPCNIISLETSEYNLQNLLKINGNKHYNFFIAQNNKKEYDQMLKNKPKNVKILYHGCVSDFKILNIKPTFMFLDFCCTFMKATDIINDLRRQIKTCKYVFLTVCLRQNKKELNDYKFDISNKITTFFPDFKFKDVVPYKDKDHAPMIFFVLKNLEINSLDLNIPEELKIYEYKICNWIIKKIKIKYPKFYEKLIERKNRRSHLFVEYSWMMCEKEEDNYIDVDRKGNESLRQEFEWSEHTWGERISPKKGFEQILCDLYDDAIKEHILVIPGFEYYKNRRTRIDDNISFFSYFLSVLDKNFDDVWELKEKEK